MDTAAVHAFQEVVWEYYQQHGRHDLPWRQPDSKGHFNPYHIVVSELMLQQTQVSRVTPKFEMFIRQFPDWESLAAAPLADVLRAWSGLGYNRRAKFLWQTAQAVVGQHDGLLPQTAKELVALPGIGSNTAGAIQAYAFNQPVVFIETNIRTVFIHHFFPGQDKVPDGQIRAWVEKTLPYHGLGRVASVLARPEGEFISPDAMRNPERVSHYREWYWALMDYGTFLKQTVGNLSRASTSYVKQSAFEGSRRQIRGQVLKLLGEHTRTTAELSQLITDERLPAVLDDLIREGFVVADRQHYYLCP